MAICQQVRPEIVAFKSKLYSSATIGNTVPTARWWKTAGETPALLVHCSAYKLTLIDWKRARCKERAAKTGALDPFSRYDAADGPFPANQPAGAKALWALSLVVIVFINTPSWLRAQVPLACRQS